MTKKYPYTLWLLSLGEFWERLTFFGTVILLVVYTHKQLQLSDGLSFSIYGVFISLSFSLPVLGGMLADRYLGLRRAILLGLVFLIIGNILLIASRLWTFYLGLAIINVGTGLYKPACTAAVGKLYKVDDPVRERAYTWFYLAMNIGATLGPIIYGVAVAYWGWHSAFIISAIGLACVLLIFSVKLKESNFIDYTFIKTSLKDTSWIYSSILLLCLLISVLFSHNDITRILFSVFAVGVILGFVIYARKQATGVKLKLYGLGCLFFFSMFFFVASFQVGSTINLFIMRDLDRTLFGWQIPTMIFGALDPLMVVITVPLFVWLWSILSKRNAEPSIVIKIVIGLLLSVFGIGCFIAAGTLIVKGVPANLQILLVFLGYFGLGAGEVCLVPALFNAGGQYAPKNIVSAIIGLVFLFIAFGGYVGSVLANISDQTTLAVTTMTRVQSVHNYMLTFAIIGLVVLFAAIILFCFSKRIQRLLNASL